MEKKKKDSVLEDYERLKEEIICEKVDEIFRTYPEDYLSRLEELGFEFSDDEDPDEEEIEERNAKPENQRQRDLVAFFENKMEVSDTIVDLFTEEKTSEDPNYPLIRKYFKSANQNLKSLLLYGLDHYPGRLDLLSDLAFFNEFDNVLSPLIAHYTQACIQQANLNTFSRLAEDFYYATNPYGYEAYYALRELFEPESDKRKILDYLIAEAETGSLIPEEGDRRCM